MKRFLFTTLLMVTLAACGDGAPSISGIKPAFGLMHGGENVVISGTNIKALMPVTVYFGNSKVFLSSLESPDELWVTSPASSREQTVDVRIIGNDGTEFLIQQAFQYVEKADMAECVNISKQLNGTPVLEQKSRRQPQK